MHECQYKAARPLHRIQKIGAQAIIGTFMTMATSVAEAEAHIATLQGRFWRKAIKTWTDIHTLPDTNPLRNCIGRMRKFRRYHRSPLYQVADAFKEMPMERLETVDPYTLAPWESRARTVTEESAEEPVMNCAVCIAVSSSARNGLVGYGMAIETRMSAHSESTMDTRSATLGPRSEQNPFTGELAGIASALDSLPRMRFRNIVLLTRNKAAVLTLKKPRQ